MKAVCWQGANYVRVETGSKVNNLKVGDRVVVPSTIGCGHCNYGQKYMHSLLDMILEGKFDPSQVVTHQLPLDAAPHAYEIFQQKKDKCIKVVLKP